MPIQAGLTAQQAQRQIQELQDHIDSMSFNVRSGSRILLSQARSTKEYLVATPTENQAVLINPVTGDHCGACINIDPRTEVFDVQEFPVCAKDSNSVELLNF